jgi:hypothetical protein
MNHLFVVGLEHLTVDGKTVINNTEKLVILGKLDRHIASMSRKTYVGNLAMDNDDLIQEGRVKVLTIINNHQDLKVKDLISLCIKSLSNFYGCLVRKSKIEKNTGIMLDLEDAFFLADKTKLEELYVELQIKHLFELMEGDEKRVLDCLINPPEELVEKAIEYYEDSYKAEVKLNRSLLSDFLGISKTELRHVIERMRLKAMPVFGI